MSPLSVAKPEKISNLLAMDDEYPSPQIVADNTIQKDWLGECARAQKDPGAFWGDYASRFAWSRKWDRVLDWMEFMYSRNRPELTAPREIDFNDVKICVNSEALKEPGFSSS